MQVKDFLRMFAYDDWANRECLVAIRSAVSILSLLLSLWLTLVITLDRKSVV